MGVETGGCPHTAIREDASINLSVIAEMNARHKDLDIIFIEGLVGHTVIGIHTSELHQPQPIVVDVQAGVARAHACDTDRIDDTIDYGEVRSRLQRLFAEHHVRLLEALAEQIAEILLHEFRAQWVRVRVAKPQVFADCDMVSVEVQARSKDKDRGAR